MNILNYNANPSNAYYNMIRKYTIKRSTMVFQSQLKRRMAEKKIDPQILSYLSLIVLDDDIYLQVREFFYIIINQMVNNRFVHNYLYMIQTI